MGNSLNRKLRALGKTIVYFALYFLGPFLFAQGIIFEKGQIVDSIAVKEAKDETFALYLPQNFDAKAPSPIVFIFEPGARGKIGISPFISASEKYGLILVCSNTSRNGPQDVNFDVANRLFNHVFSSFSIAEDQLYISGFSGGARLATAIAVLTNRFAGVLACGAGFPQLPQQAPSTQTFAYAGIVGDTDFNYRELHNTRDYLNRIRFNHTLFTFKGKHQWPPQAEILRAFDWFYLQQELKKRPLTKKALIPQFQRDMASAKTREIQGDLLAAAQDYDRILQNYKLAFSMDSTHTIYTKLLSSKAYKALYTSRKKAFTKEGELSKKLYDKLFSDFKNPKKARLTFWKKEMAKLNTLKKKGDAEIQKMVERLKFGLYASCFESVYLYPEKNNPEVQELSSAIRNLIYEGKP